MTATQVLSAEQEAFLEECALEFSDRFTDADLEYKKIYDSGIPAPPIMCPWYARRFNNRNNRDRPGGSGYNDRNYQNRRNCDNERHENNHSYNDRHSKFYEHRSQHSFRPY